MSVISNDNRGLLGDLALAMVLALSLRILYLLALQRAIDMADAIHYIQMAQQFASGDFLNFDENLPVLFSIFGAAVHVVVPNWEYAFWVVSLAASTLLVVPVYLLARELHGRSAAQIAALVVSMWPWLVDYGSRIAPEALAVTLFFTSILLLYRGFEGRNVSLAFAPLAFFALHLTRPEGTFIMLAAPFGALVLCWRRGRYLYRRWGVFTACCAVLLGIYAVFMRVAIGTATLSYRAPMAGDVTDYFRRGATDFARTAMALFFDVLPVMLGPLLLVFLGLGIFGKADGPRRIRLEVLILFFCAVQWSLTLANFSSAPRYIMTVVVALSLWSARGIELAARQAAEARHGAWLKHVPLSVVAAAMLVGIVSDVASESLSGMPRTPREYRIAGHWMRDELEPGYIICRKPQVGFYAEMPSVGPDPAHDADAVVAFAQDIGARYLVVDERYSADIVPGLRPLLDPARAPDTLKLLRDDLSPYEGAKIVVYEVVVPGIHYLAPEDFPTTSSHRGPDKIRRKKGQGEQ